ncbi:hypothetical protein EMCRGX_G004666 [Ephydatia muelleri]
MADSTVANTSKEQKVVNLSQLGVPQLEQIKTQLEEDLSLLSSSMQQLKAVQQRLKDSKESLDYINPKNSGAQVLVPLTSSMYVPGTLRSNDSVIVEIGTGYYVRKTLKDAVAFFERRIDYVTRNLENLQLGLIEKHKIREAVLATMQMKLQGQLVQQKTTS